MYGSLGGYFLIKNSLLNDFKNPITTKFDDPIIRDKSYDFLGSYSFGNYNDHNTNSKTLFEDYDD